LELYTSILSCTEPVPSWCFMGSRTRVSENRFTGTVLSWKGRFGWIRPEKRINHEEAAKHGGRVYVHISDVEGRQELSENSRVSFLAYGDGDGLGAEQVRVEGQALGRDIIAGVATVVRTRATQRGYGVGPSAPPRPAGTAGAGAAAPGAPGAPGAPAAAGAAGAASAKGQGNSSSSTANGMAMAAEAAFKYIPPPGTVRWWKDLVGDCCPISLTQLEELSVDPFGLLGTSENDEALPSEGIWGKAGEMMVRNNQQQAVHWFDGMFLASFLVSSGQLIDPVNRRSLSRGECKSLDEYIQAHGFPAVHVTDAYDLARAVKTTSQASDGPAAARMAILEREAASMLRSLFDFRTVGSRGAQASGPPAPATGQEAPVLQQTHWPALGEQAAQDRKPSVQQPSSERRIRTCTQRTVHNDGGLQVVDDTEFDIEYEEEEEEQSPPDPTLADSAASVPRRTRLARLPRRDGAQITFSVTGRAREPIEGRGGGARTAATSTPQPRLEEATSDSEDEQESGALEVEAWIPDWATPALHARLLTEIEVIEAMRPDEFQVLTPKVQTQLKDCLARGCVSRAPDPLRLQVAQHIDGPGGGCEVAVEFSMPPFYPLHEPGVSLRVADDNGGSPGWVRDALQNLQGTIRTEVLPKFEGSEVIEPVLQWLSQHASTTLSRAEREATEGKKARRQEAAAVPAPAADAKAERIEQARKERLSAKFSEKWDLCYAFIKHGSCKDKNCQWRHELPKKPVAEADKEKGEKGEKGESEKAAKSTKLGKKKKT
ncbi:unnamed protein product, partial [Effrenium voratum]